MAIHERIRELRMAHNLTQKQVATLLHTTQQAYLKYEKGTNEIPAWRIALLCQHYQVSADYILGLIDEPLPIEKDPSV